ncbi:uncharacterized protein LOC107644946 [Arachis ipaensis]|uniref:uncharacterized protein LOC107644946 n=1 Tax=Arachis ipaensis TaxID=130454 RepID=UPI0007AFD788|nr:uncharacterized protein LOC107644946 [Arachis ipaensis]XP_025657058.1 uncharacterized protein LOC112751936 [Arachis hypogaea]
MKHLGQLAKIWDSRAFSIFLYVGSADGAVLVGDGKIENRITQCLHGIICDSCRHIERDCTDSCACENQCSNNSGNVEVEPYNCQEITHCRLTTCSCRRMAMACTAQCPCRGEEESCTNI